MLKQRGVKCSWTFDRFCELAHRNATALREAILSEFPTLGSDWSQLYAEKKQIYETRVAQGDVELMPGVAPLLGALAQSGIERCVVTNSFYGQISAIRKSQSSLQTIPHWITREDYEEPKPSSECYLKAIQRFGKPGGKVIGFEDSLRGLQALLGTPALPVLVCPSHHPLLGEVPDHVLCIDSLANISSCFE